MHINQNGIIGAPYISPFPTRLLEHVLCLRKKTEICQLAQLQPDLFAEYTNWSPLPLACFGVTEWQQLSFAS